MLEYERRSSRILAVIAYFYGTFTRKLRQQMAIMGRGSRPICRVGPKTPQNKMAATVG